MRFAASPSSGHPIDFDDRESNQGGEPGRDHPVGPRIVLGDGRHLDREKKRQADRPPTRSTSPASQRDEYPQVFTEIDVVHEVTGTDLSEAAIRRAIELSATKYCPVNAMLSAGATVVHHRYVIHSGGATPFEASGEVVATGPYARPDIIAAERGISH